MNMNRETELARMEYAVHIDSMHHGDDAWLATLKARGFTHAYEATVLDATDRKILKEEFAQADNLMMKRRGNARKHYDTGFAEGQDAREKREKAERKARSAAARAAREAAGCHCQGRHARTCPLRASSAPVTPPATPDATGAHHAR